MQCSDCRSAIVCSVGSDSTRSVQCRHFCHAMLITCSSSASAAGVSEATHQVMDEPRTRSISAKSEKTDAQRAREKKLLDDLVQIVDKRDELVRHLDNQEKAIEEDELVESATQRPITLEEENDKNCRIM
ncbi:DUF3585 [Tyrophagus putrescentiae]|nr:DUF3585 [Tyrophagus putrescentiae]